MRCDVQWVSPTPPLRTGIANYTADMFAATDGVWSIATVGEDGSRVARYRSVHQIPARSLQPDIPTVIHLGNSEYHDIAFEVARRMPAIVVLHDVLLHHARAALAVRSGNTRQYWSELQREYGSSGVAAGRSLFAGREPEDLADFPMFEPFVRGSLATVVHNENAAEAVRSRVPDARVIVVPMGIPIPAVFQRDLARKSLGLADSDFAIGSITHVNPNKRISVVLRAMRRLVVQVPNAKLLLAGTGSDGELLTREIEILGLQNHVHQYGYVDDQTARTLASAADACVNLRYPTTGETSASLLRLLGAGLPVLVSDAGSSSELPDGVGLRIPVNAHEVEMVAAVLRALAENPAMREDAGRAARDFVVSQHSMVNMVDGYRSVLEEIYDVHLLGITQIPVEKMALPIVPSSEQGELGAAHRQAAAAIAELGLVGEGAALLTTGRTIVDLGLDRADPGKSGMSSTRLRERVACPVCGGIVNSEWSCTECGAEINRVQNAADLR